MVSSRDRTCQPPHQNTSYLAVQREEAQQPLEDHACQTVLSFVRKWCCEAESGVEKSDEGENLRICRSMAGRILPYSFLLLVFVAIAARARYGLRRNLVIHYVARW